MNISDYKNNKYIIEMETSKFAMQRNDNNKNNKLSRRTKIRQKYPQYAQYNKFETNRKEMI